MSTREPGGSKTAQKLQAARSAKAKKQPANPTRILWLGLGAAALVFTAVFLAVRALTAIPFTFVGGDKAPIVILRNPEDVHYQLQVSGDKPVRLTRLVPMIQTFQGQVLYVDVDGVKVTVGEREVTLETGGGVPDGTDLVLQPGDLVDITVTYFGQELGHNWVYGFRLGYLLNGRAFEEDLQIDEGYFVYVE
jgi:hypothetical protein